MKIYKARVMGFCYGVRKAMEIAENAAVSGQKTVTLGPIIHNPQGVARLAGKGISPVASTDEIIDETLSAVSSERTTRVIDNEAAGSMERRKREGYF